jgi:hypothetical protein
LVEHQVVEGGDGALVAIEVIVHWSSRMSEARATA